MRTSEQMRSTKETRVTVRLNLDGGDVAINTGVGFFDHMLEAFAVHGGFGLEVAVKGDLEVDCHHTIEDAGIVLGRAFCEALGDKSGIARYGSFLLPMDETLASAAVDVSGRPYLVFNGGARRRVRHLHVRRILPRVCHERRGHAAPERALRRQFPSPDRGAV